MWIIWPLLFLLSDFNLDTHILQAGEGCWDNAALCISVDRYKVLSDIILQSGEDKEQIKTQLYEEMDPDTRIILLHCAS